MWCQAPIHFITWLKSVYKRQSVPPYYTSGTDWIVMIDCSYQFRFLITSLCHQKLRSGWYVLTSAIATWLWSNQFDGNDKCYFHMHDNIIVNCRDWPQRWILSTALIVHSKVNMWTKTKRIEQNIKTDCRIQESSQKIPNPTRPHS